MNNLTFLEETENTTIYVVEDELQGLVSIPKDLNNNIKVYMAFEKNKNEFISKMKEITKTINNNQDGILIITIIKNNINEIDYPNILAKIKNLVNKIYNDILKEKKVTKENFIKKIEFLSSEEEYNNLINWLCLQNPNKFHLNNQKLMNTKILNETTRGEILTQNIEKITISPFSQPINNLNNTNGTENNLEPITEKLTIGSFTPTINNSSFPKNETTNNVNQPEEVNKKKLLRVPDHHNNAAFIKLPTIIFVLIMSLVIGITFSISLLK